MGFFSPTVTHVPWNLFFPNVLLTIGAAIAIVICCASVYLQTLCRFCSRFPRTVTVVFTTGAIVFVYVLADMAQNIRSHTHDEPAMQLARSCFAIAASIMVGWLVGWCEVCKCVMVYVCVCVCVCMCVLHV